jgi:hypothetical protein
MRISAKYYFKQPVTVSKQLPVRGVIALQILLRPDWTEELYLNVEDQTIVDYIIVNVV